MFDSAQLLNFKNTYVMVWKKTVFLARLKMLV